MDEMETMEMRSAEERAPLGQRDRGEFRFSPQTPLDFPSPLPTTRAVALNPGLGAEAGEEPEAELNPETETGEDAGDDRRAELTRGLTALAEDGWTAEELTAFSQDGQAVRDIAEGRSLESAALRYMRRARSAGEMGRATFTPGRRAGVPTMRSAGAGETDVGNPIARMSDREFDAFYANAMAKAMTGARVRI